MLFYIWILELSLVELSGYGAWEFKPTAAFCLVATDFAILWAGCFILMIWAMTGCFTERDWVSFLVWFWIWTKVRFWEAFWKWALELLDSFWATTIVELVAFWTAATVEFWDAFWTTDVTFDWLRCATWATEVVEFEVFWRATVLETRDETVSVWFCLIGSATLWT